MLRIAICDDEENEIEYLKHAVEDWAKKEDILTNIETYASAESFLFQYEECKNYQILLLDVEMSGMSGIDLAKNIRQNQDNVEIIFITSHFEFIGEGYEVDALHYLVKPVKISKMEEVLSKAKCKIEAGESSIIIHYEGEVVKLYEKEILYLESLSHYVTIYTKDKEYKIKANISTFAQELSEDFYQTHRSYLVSLKHIMRMKWSDFYDDNCNHRKEYLSGKESIVICPAVLDAIDYYLERTNRNPKIEYNDYIFNIACKTQWVKRKGNVIYAANDLDAWCEWLNKDFSDKRKEKIIKDFEKQDVYHSLGEYLYYEVEWNDVVKWQTDTYRRQFHKAAKEINVQYNVSTHSLRKTFGYISAMIHPKDIDSLEILQSIFQHSSTQQTKEYIGLGDERKRQYYLDMGEFIYFLENRDSYFSKEENDPAYISIKYDELKQILVDVVNEYDPNRIEIIDKFLYLLDENLGKSTTDTYTQNDLQENTIRIENCENLDDELIIEYINGRDDVKSFVDRKYSNDSTMQDRMMKFYDMGIVEDFLDLDTVDDEIIAHAAMEVEVVCNVSFEEAKVIVIEWMQLLGI